MLSRKSLPLQLPVLERFIFSWALLQLWWVMVAGGDCLAAPWQGACLANLNLFLFCSHPPRPFDLSAPVLGSTDHFLVILPSPSISVCATFPAISYATPYHLLQPDKLLTQTVPPDLAWSLPRDINDTIQMDNGVLINIQLLLFQHAV